MKTVLSAFILFLLLNWVPCASAADPEPLLAISTDAEKGTLSIDVFSSGCTDKKDFRFDFNEGVLMIVRTERDACKAIPMRATLIFSLKEAGLKPKSAFRLGNPIVFATEGGL